jgi:hypothetical protein
MNWWIPVAFAAGWISCWKLSDFLMRRILRKGDKFLLDALSSLPQSSLLKVHFATEDELEKRRNS